MNQIRGGSWQIQLIVVGEKRVVEKGGERMEMGGGRVGIGFNEQTGETGIISLSGDISGIPCLGIREAHKLGIKVEIPDKLRQRRKLGSQFS